MWSNNEIEFPNIFWKTSILNGLRVDFPAKRNLNRVIEGRFYGYWCSWSRTKNPVIMWPGFILIFNIVIYLCVYVRVSSEITPVRRAIFEIFILVHLNQQLKPYKTQLEIESIFQRHQTQFPLTRIILNIGFIICGPRDIF